MNVGTKSLLFGAHQFILHPLTVLWAWRKLYGKWPSFMELVCIIIHDWGYWGCDSMDGKDGTLHPCWAAAWFEPYSYHYDLCLFHSRHLARLVGGNVSKLYHADKLSFTYVPWWLYVPLCMLSGEIYEYRRLTDDAELTLPTMSWKEWHNVVKSDMRSLSVHPDNVPYLQGDRV